MCTSFSSRFFFSFLFSLNQIYIAHIDTRNEYRNRNSKCCFRNGKYQHSILLASDMALILFFFHQFHVLHGYIIYCRTVSIKMCSCSFCYFYCKYKMTKANENVRKVHYELKIELYRNVHQIVKAFSIYMMFSLYVFCSWNYYEIETTDHFFHMYHCRR